MSKRMPPAERMGTDSPFRDSFVSGLLKVSEGRWRGSEVSSSGTGGMSFTGAEKEGLILSSIRVVAVVAAKEKTGLTRNNRQTSPIIIWRSSFNLDILSIFVSKFSSLSYFLTNLKPNFFLITKKIIKRIIIPPTIKPASGKVFCCF